MVREEIELVSKEEGRKMRTNWKTYASFWNATLGVPSDMVKIVTAVDSDGRW